MENFFLVALVFLLYSAAGGNALEEGSEPPSIFKYPRSDVVSAAEGDAVVLECHGRGGSADITWDRMDGDMSPYLLVEGPRLTFPSVSRGDEGEYRCTAANGSGQEASEYFALVVEYKPKVTISPDKPYGMKASVGGKLEVLCRVDARPPATVGWYRTGRANLLVSGGGDVAANSSDARRLVLDPVRFGDFGTYRCVALNRVGVASASVEIENADPPSLEIQPSTGLVLAQKGDAVVLTCVADEDPTRRITWEKKNPDPYQFDGAYLTLPGRGTDLFLPAVSRQDSGDYVCSAWDHTWRRSFADIKLEVEYKPEIVLERDFVQARNGERLEILHTVYSHSRPRVEWFRDDSFKLGVERGSSLLLTRHEEGSDEYRFSLVVEDFDAERDACVYTCLAANKLGVSSARVTVSGLPTATTNATSGDQSLKK